MKTVQVGDLQIQIEGDVNLGGGTIIHGLERIACPYCNENDCLFSCDMSQGQPEGETLETDEQQVSRHMFNGAMDGIESILLALACEGVDIETTEFREALKTTTDAVSNNVL